MRMEWWSRVHGWIGIEGWGRVEEWREQETNDALRIKDGGWKGKGNCEGPKRS